MHTIFLVLLMKAAIINVNQGVLLKMNAYPKEDPKIVGDLIETIFYIKVNSYHDHGILGTII